MKILSPALFSISLLATPAVALAQASVDAPVVSAVGIEGIAQNSSCEGCTPEEKVFTRLAYVNQLLSITAETEKRASNLNNTTLESVLQMLKSSGMNEQALAEIRQYLVSKSSSSSIDTTATTASDLKALTAALGSAEIDLPVEGDSESSVADDQKTTSSEKAKKEAPSTWKPPSINTYKIGYVQQSDTSSFVVLIDSQGAEHFLELGESKRLAGKTYELVSIGLGEGSAYSVELMDVATKQKHRIGWGS